jgi:hypothetical protein
MKIILQNLTKTFPSRNKKWAERSRLSTISILKYRTAS